jgi:hypothetical protein
MYHIEICGGIATGKTTLANRLHKICGLEVFTESFSEVPFWKESYESRGKKYVFQKNIGFLLFHAHRLAEATACSKVAVCDFAYFQDLAYADLSPPEDHAILASVSSRFVDVLPAASGYHRSFVPNRCAAAADQGSRTRTGTGHRRTFLTATSLRDRCPSTYIGTDSRRAFRRHRQ